MDSAGIRNGRHCHENSGRPAADTAIRDLKNGISHSNAVFDRAELPGYTEYIRAYPAEKLPPLIQEEWHKAGLEPARTDPDWLFATINLS